MRELPEDLRALKERVCRDFHIADTEHKWHRDRWDAFYRQWHSYTDFKRSYAETNDTDGILRDGQREWGATLYIPYTYVCVETILPRMLSNRPRMLFTPRDPLSSQNTENMRWMLDAQQDRMRFELRLQTLAKIGLITGLGVGKGRWKHERRRQWQVVPNPMPARENGFARYLRAQVDRVVWDDPYWEAIDPYNWLWDPFAFDMESLGFCVHREWLSTRDVLRRIRSGDWDLFEDARDWSVEDIEGQGAGTRYDEVYSGRKDAQGLGGRPLPSGRHVHEVWEYHDGERVVTILNREWPVRDMENPSWSGDMPFQIFRPTEVPGSMVGKGEPEPIADLQDEMNTMRSQRRDNATLALQGSYFYEDGAFDPADIRHGAGIYNAVNSMGDLRNAIMPMPVKDIPNSSYQEEARLQGDIERVTGLSDSGVGASSSGETATGAQLTNAAANVRIQLKTRRLELETIAPAARQMMHLDQQHILEQRDVPIPTTPAPGEPDRVWAWRRVGPVELRGDWEIAPEGGSTQPANVPQDRQDAQGLMAGFINVPIVDQRKIVEEALKKYGVKNPERFLVPDQHIPPETLELMHAELVRMGADPAMVDQLIQWAVEMGRRMEAVAPPAAPGDIAPPPPEEGPEGGGPPPGEQEPVAA